MISASGAVCSSASRSAPALKPSSWSSRTNLKRGPSSSQCSSIGRHIARIRRVVDHHDAFEIRPVELGHAVQRLAQHLRRLAIGRNVDRHEGAPVRHDVARRQQALRTAAKHDLGKLVEALLHDHDERHEQPAPTNMAICEPSTK